MIEAWSVVPGNWEAATDENSDPEKIHWGIAQMLNHAYSVERSWAIYWERRLKQEKLFALEGTMWLYSLSFDEEEGGRIYQSTFDLSLDRHKVETIARPLVRTSELAPGEIWTHCVGGDIRGVSGDWWQKSVVDGLKTASAPGSNILSHDRRCSLGCERSSWRRRRRRGDLPRLVVGWTS